MTIPKINSKEKKVLYLTYFLQKECDLTFKEARVILTDISGETYEDLAKEFDCTLQAIYNFRRKGLKKLESASFELVEPEE